MHDLPVRENLSMFDLLSWGSLEVIQRANGSRMASQQDVTWREQQIWRGYFLRTILLMLLLGDHSYILSDFFPGSNKQVSYSLP